MQVYDAIVIGAGVSGCAIARELSMYGGRFAVIEREEDVCAGTTKANSAIVHAGFDAQPGSLMARLNVEGSRRMPRLCKELGVDYDPIGALVVCTATAKETTSNRASSRRCSSSLRASARRLKATCPSPPSSATRCTRASSSRRRAVLEGE